MSSLSSLILHDISVANTMKKANIRFIIVHVSLLLYPLNDEEGQILHEEMLNFYIQNLFFGREVEIAWDGVLEGRGSQ